MECFNDGITKKKNENEIMKELIQFNNEDHYENELTIICVELGEKSHQLHLQNHRVKEIETLNSYQS